MPLGKAWLLLKMNFFNGLDAVIKVIFNGYADAT